MMARPLIVLTTLAVLALAVAAPGGATKQGTSFVQVTEKEWQLTLSRASVAKGRVIIEVLNFGTDNHDLIVQAKKKGAKQFRFKVIDPRGRTERSLSLTPGRYALWCSLPQHKQRGMATTLVVRS